MIQISGISRSWLLIQPWCHRFVEAGSAIWFRWKIPFWCKSCTKWIGRRWLCWLPGHGSVPILTLTPLPTFQAKPSRMRGITLHKAFQMIEPFGIFELGRSLIQSRRGVGAMYLWVITYVQRLWVEISLQPTFAAKIFANRRVFFRPHPPNSFGLSIWSHFTQGRTLYSLFPVQRKWE